MIKTILIDDEPLARELVREYLRDFPEVEVVAECNDGFEGLKAIQQHQPDLLFLDIQMPKINGFEMLELVDKLPRSSSPPRSKNMRSALLRSAPWITSSNRSPKTASAKRCKDAGPPF